MTDTATLQALLARVESAVRPDRALDADLFRMATGQWNGTVGYAEVPAYTASIDAALALIERLLPTYPMILLMTHAMQRMRHGVDSSSFSSRLPRGILITLLEALIDNNA